MTRTRWMSARGFGLPAILVASMVVGGCSKAEPPPVPNERVGTAASAVTGTASNASNFNGTSIAAGHTIWFTSVAKVSGGGSQLIHLTITNSQIAFTASGQNYALVVPSAQVTINPSASSATTTFDGASQSWQTAEPAQFAGNGFLTALAYVVPANLPGGINPVTWTATFTSDVPGLTVQWQWAAAIYTQFGASYGALGVKPVDDNQISIYKNSDHAGTPEAFKTFVTGGARGGGGSNYTGSLSGTVSVTPTVTTLCSGVVCIASDQCHAAGSCDPGTGLCSNPPATNGTACSDGNACTQADTCQAGACAGGTPVVCGAQDQCHVAGTCDPSTGLCSNPSAANGTSCNDNSACTQADACQGGICTGSNPIVCTASDQCHAVGSCDPSSGTCSNPAATNGTACNDGNACTQVDACVNGSCSGTSPVVCTAFDQCHVTGACDQSTGICSNPAAANGTVCTDGNSCTTNDVCTAGVCGGTAVSCSASDQCHVAGTCNPATGTCSNPSAANGAPCNDGSACTTGDACAAGVCGGAAVTCTASDQCHTAGTCNPSTGFCSNPTASNGSACSDGNACTTSDTCQAGTCMGSTPVACAAQDQCHVVGTCDPATGTCSNPAAAAGTSCNDGLACTTNDLCTAGACAGTAVTCTASDQCHVAGSCNPATGVCSSPAAPNGTGCSDGNACTTSDVCTAGTCGGTGVTCAASDPCHVAGTCDPATGTCSNPTAAAGISCSDGNACNGSEACNGSGSCLPGTPPTLNDNNPCTSDACDPATGVTHAPLAQGAACSDGNACNGSETCSGAGVCVAGAPPVLDDGNPCTADACDPATGVSHAPVANGTSCSDGNACNGPEICSGAGTCVAGAPPIIDDGNPCTTDGCDPGSGVSHAPVAAGASCSDGNACNGAETCDGSGLCKPGTPSPINDGNPCTTDVCDPALGVTHTPTAAGTSCSDGNACNGAETCSGAGTCVAGAPPVLDDGNPCTTDVCENLGGVGHVPVPAGFPCSDGNACNGAEACNGAGVCVPGPAPSLDDGNPCTMDACAPAGGITHQPALLGASCSDGNACNGAESCDGAGSCVQGAAPAVDDGNPCTTDACDPANGVTHVPLPGSAACSDGNACNGAETCNVAGICVAGAPPVLDDGNVCTTDTCDPVLGVGHAPVAVDDGNPCTTDTCQPGTGVTHVTLPGGGSCSDGNACNGVEICSGAGTCLPGTPPALDDSNPCTADACDSLLGVTHAPLPAGSPCGGSQGDLCKGSGNCDSAGTCLLSAPAVPVDDGNPCTIDGCDPATGIAAHTPLPAGTPCDDSNPCNGSSETCTAAGACVAAVPAPPIDDGNPCTADVCLPGGVVAHSPLAADTPCADATRCNGDELCDNAAHCKPGVPPTIDDKNPCTVDTCNPATAEVTHALSPAGTSCADPEICNGYETCDGAGTCLPGTAFVDGIDCPGHDACAAPGSCISGTCVPTVVVGYGGNQEAPPAGNPAIDDHNSCTVDACDPVTGPAHTPLPPGTPCKDNPCFGFGTCSNGGACVGQSADVNGCDDGNPCNGFEFCRSLEDPSLGCYTFENYELQVDDYNPCTIDTCDPATSTVAHVPVPGGTSCSDGDPCNGVEVCNNAGVCLAGIPFNVPDDGNPCTDNLCIAGNPFYQWRDPGAPCPDGILCNGAETCDGAGNCLPGVPQLIPDDGNPCTDSVCDPQLGLLTTPLAAGTACSSWDFCAGQNVCDGAGTCVPGLPMPIDDGDACTADSCISWAYIVQHVPVPIDDGNPCTIDGCDPATGVFHTPAAAGTPCPDANLCNGAETCSGTSCVAGVPPVLDDGHLCTVDSCDPAQGVLHVAVVGGTSCADSNPCNGNELCNGAGQCSAGAPPLLDDGNDCTTDACTPLQGVTHTWLQNPACDAMRSNWDLAVGGRPSPRDSAAFAFDDSAGKAVLFGGENAGAALADTWSWDRATELWSVSYKTGPSARAAASMAFDAARKRLVVFGGVAGRNPNALYLNDVWDYDVAQGTWTPRPAAGASPPPRAYAGIAYDAGSQHVFVFGGAVAGGAVGLSDTWEWNGVDGSWTPRIGGVVPPARGGAALVFDSDRSRLVLFGGTKLGASGPGDLLGDTWEFDAGANTWTDRTSPIAPPARVGHAMSYDVNRHRIVLTGGTSGASKTLGDTWEYDGGSGSWVERAESGAPPRAGHAAAYDATSGKTLAVGGLVYSQSGVHTPGLDELWEYDGDAGKWSPRTQKFAPALAGGGFAYDSTRKLLVLRGLEPRPMMWELNDGGGRWTPHDALTGQPDFGLILPAAIAHSNGQLLYDSARGKTIFVAAGRGPTGVSAAVASPELWEWDGATWLRRACAGAPVARESAAVTYDPLRQRVVLFGGAYSAGALSQSFNDTWELDPAACVWSQRLDVIGTSPPPTLDALMIWDSARSVAVLFGGGQMQPGNANPVPSNETWEWNGAAGTWTERGTPGTAPPPRANGALTYDSVRKRVVLFGGRVGQSAVGDTWEFDGVAGTWMQLAPVHTPSPRERASVGFDPERARVVLFGGSANEAAPFSDLWEWDGTDWARRPLGVAPSARSGASGGWIPYQNLAVFFGGTRGDGERAYLQDTWIWQGSWALASSWTDDAAPREYGVSPSLVQSFGNTWDTPPARTGHALGVGYRATDFDKSGLGLLFGGEGDTGLLADTWTWDDGTFTWQEYPASGPAPRTEHAMALLPHVGYLMFGGLNGSAKPLGDAWTWQDFNGWQHVAGGGGAPSARSGHAMATDTIRGKIVLFGGRDANAALADVWEWDVGGSTWAERTPPFSPPARFGHRLAYDPVREKVILTGGTPTSSATAFGDAWEWDGAAGTWQPREPLTALDPRAGHLSFFDETLGDVIVFSGLSYREQGAATIAFGDTWSLGHADASDGTKILMPNGIPCANSATCASGQCVDGFCCNSPCAGQCGACNVPGSEGKCVATTGAPQGARPSCDAPGLCGPRCDGSDTTACHAPPSGTACGTGSCSAGVATPTGKCDLNGTCVVPFGASCDPYQCEGAACATSCANTPCVSSAYFCWKFAGIAQCRGKAVLNYFAAAPQSPIVGSAVILSAFAAGSVAPQYRFSYLNASSQPVYPCGDYKAVAVCAWVPPAAGSYEWLVEARDPESLSIADDSKQLSIDVGTSP